MKRGTSGLSMVLAVNKPSGMTSHDVVSRVRRIFGERRVGHAGTLDPLASGVLPIFVGPATRLNQFISSKSKSYVADVVFGRSTVTDDIEGETLHTSNVPSNVLDPDFAASYCDSLVGKSQQLPPVYSAIKVDGKKSCDEARRGNIVELLPRDIEIYAAKLISVGNGNLAAEGLGKTSNGNAYSASAYAEGGKRGAESLKYDGAPFWTVAFDVSKGTYIRALARDIGTGLGTHAHIGSLLRDRVGNLGIDECLSLDALSSQHASAIIDPVRLLEMRIVFPIPDAGQKVVHGGSLRIDEFRLFRQCGSFDSTVCCTSSIKESKIPPTHGEHVALIEQNLLRAICVWDDCSKALKPQCVFQIGVSRGSDI